MTANPRAPVLDLLRSLGVRDPNTLYALAARLPGEGAEDPARAARVILGEWFARLLGRGDLDAEQAFLLGAPPSSPSMAATAIRAPS